MTPAEEAEMKRIQQELGPRFCHRTEKIPISTVMASPTFSKRMPPEQVFYGWLGQAVEKAANCAECGLCEERCPYHLPIKELLAERVKWFREEKRKYEESKTK